MKTSISNKAFVALPIDRRTKYLQNRCSFMRGICTKKIGAISQLGAEKTWLTYGQTDICFYRVALLLTKMPKLYRSLLLKMSPCSSYGTTTTLTQSLSSLNGETIVVITNNLKINKVKHLLYKI